MYSMLLTVSQFSVGEQVRPGVNVLLICGVISLDRL